MKTLPNIHPGEVLLEEFLVPLGVSQNALARAAGVPPRRINEIVLGKRGSAQTPPFVWRVRSAPASVSGWDCKRTTICKKRIARSTRLPRPLGDWRLERRRSAV
jgi:hypothetical protein